MSTPPDRSRKFFNISGGLLFALISGLILLCCVAPVVTYAFREAMPGLFPTPDPSVSASPSTVVESCKVVDGTVVAKVEVRNNASQPGSYSVRVEATNGAGTGLGADTQAVRDLPAGGSMLVEFQIPVASASRVRCAVVDVSRIVG